MSKYIKIKSFRHHWYFHSWVL